MAHIRKIGDKWRTEVEREGVRKSKRFLTKRAADLWAAEQAAAIVGSAGKPDYTHTVQDVVVARKQSFESFNHC